MTPSDIMQAWKDPHDRAGLLVTPLTQLPASPAGAIELPEPTLHAAWQGCASTDDHRSTTHPVARLNGGPPGMRRAQRAGSGGGALRRVCLSMVRGILVAAILVAAGYPVAARPIAEEEEEPHLGCLAKVTGWIKSSSPSVPMHSAVVLSWHVYVPGGCAPTLSVTGLTAPIARNDARTVVPIGIAATGQATYRLSAYLGGTTKPLGSVTVTVRFPEPVYGRRTVEIKNNSQVDWFIKAIGTPNTTVLLADDLNLDLSGRSVLPIAWGVHILGGRSSTTPGPRLFTTAIRTAGPQPLFAIGEYWDADGVRISGVRIDGGDMGIAGNGVTQDDDPVTPIGIRVSSSVNVEIAHSEIYGWSGIVVQVLDPRDRLSGDNASAVWIHDNYIHHNRRYRHEGYGVQTGEDAYALIERNVFDSNRHALESSGAPRTGYLAYSNLLFPGGGENAHLWPVTTYTHQFDVHGTASCGGKDAYCGDAGEYFDYRYNTLLYTAGDVLKVRGEPTIGADVTQNVFAKGEGSSAISQTAGDNLVAWNNTFNANVFESYQALVCDFDGNAEPDDFLATGATWWYRSHATGQFYYLNTSTTMVGALAFGDVNGDGRCDVTVSADGTVFHGGRAAGGRATATLKAAAKRTDLVWAPPYTGWGTGGQGLLGRLSPTLHSVVDEAPVSLIKETTLGEAGNVSPTGRVLGTGDFNGDGATDLLWDNGGGGITQFIRVTLLDGSSASTSGNIVVPGPLGRTAGATSGVSADRGVLPPNAQLAGIGDFNADGRSDILWRREDGQLLLWFAGESWNSALVTWGNNLDVDGNGIGHPQDAPVPVDWQVQGIGDFDGDGYSDILWRHDGGQVAIWYMVHAMHVGDAYPGGTDPTRVWEIQGVGDFDADGQADILWRDVHGALAIWVRGLYDTGLRPTHPSGIIGYEWQIHGVGDFNADGHTDLLWRHTDGTVSIWTMHGGTYLGESAPLPMDPAWPLRGLLAQAPQRLNLQ